MIQNSISVHDLAAWRQDRTPHALLDVREDQELGICAIDDATHIPMGQVPKRLAELPREIPLVVMCHHGMRSLNVMRYLHQAGWENAVNLDGGIAAWAEQIDPAMPRY